jgi:hypothetical protein
MMMTRSIRLMAHKVPGRAPPGPGGGGTRIIGVVVYLIGEWIPAWAFMSIAFGVAFLGVVGLGWWVLRGEARNRRFDEPSEEAAEH